MPAPHRAIEFDIDSVLFRRAIDVLRRGGVTYTAWIASLAAEEAYAIGQLFGQLLLETDKVRDD